MVLLPFLILSGLSGTENAGAQEQPASVAFRHVTIVDVAGTTPRSDYTEAIVGGRIAEVGPTSQTRIPKGSVVVEASGKFLIPGLWDMHIHTASVPLRRPVDGTPQIEENAQYIFPLLLASGVTGIRDMSGDLNILTHWRQEVATGSRLGPRMVVTGRKLASNNPVVPGAPFPIRTPEDVRQSVRLLREQGADFVKLDLLPPRLYPIVAEASKAEGLPFVGHVHPRESVLEASDWGQKSVEHLQGLLLICSTDAPALLAAPSSAQMLWERLLTRLGLRDPLMEEERRLRHLLDTQSDSLAALAFARFVQNGTWQVPTLTLLRDLKSPLAGDSIPTEMRAYIPPSLLERRRARLPEIDAALAQRRYARQLALVGAMAKAGVPMLAGTDAIALRRMPGFSLADELTLMVEAGLTPQQALWTATVGPAQFLGMQDSLGTVAVGKLADLVLLDASPLHDIQNLRKIRGVVVAGRYLSRARLDQLLREVRELVESWREASSGQALDSVPGQK